MDQKKIKKIVYEDAGITKVLKGIILKEDEFTYEVEAVGTRAIIIIGKRSIVKVCDGGH